MKEVINSLFPIDYAAANAPDAVATASVQGLLPKVQEQLWPIENTEPKLMALQIQYFSPSYSVQGEREGRSRGVLNRGQKAGQGSGFSH